MKLWNVGYDGSIGKATLDIPNHIIHVRTLFHEPESFQKRDRTDNVEGIPLKPSAKVHRCGRALHHGINKDIRALIDQRLQLAY